MDPPEVSSILFPMTQRNMDLNTTSSMEGREFGLC